MTRTRDPALVTQARAAAAAGETPARIAARIGRHPTTVQRWLKGTPAARTAGRPAGDSAGAVIRELRDAGASWSQIAAVTGVPRSTARGRYTAAASHRHQEGDTR